jgi:hypothetical protein
MSPGKAAIGATLTFQGSGFSPAAATNTIVFTGATGSVSIPAATATSTTLTVAVPPGAITGPVFVQTGGQSSAIRILEVLATSTSLLPASTVNVAAAAKATGVDIYVPPAVGSLNANIVGLGDAGTSISLGSSSVEIGRGQTKQLVIGGSGLSAANGTTVTISGDGVSVAGSPQFQGTFIIVNITASGGATTGARNIIVTNSNLDVSVLSGGLFVR